MISGGEKSRHGSLPSSATALALVVGRGSTPAKSPNCPSRNRTGRGWVTHGWRLRRIFVNGPARSALRRPNWGFVGVCGRPHAGQGPMVLPRRRDRGLCKRRPTGWRAHLARKFIINISSIGYSLVTLAIFCSWQFNKKVKNNWVIQIQLYIFNPPTSKIVFLEYHKKNIKKDI